jgi:hypothetical protein
MADRATFAMNVCSDISNLPLKYRPEQISIVRSFAYGLFYALTDTFAFAMAVKGDAEVESESTVRELARIDSIPNFPVSFSPRATH